MSTAWTLYCHWLKGWEGYLGKIYFVTLQRSVTALNNQKKSHRNRETKVDLCGIICLSFVIENSIKAVYVDHQN